MYRKFNKQFDHHLLKWFLYKNDTECYLLYCTAFGLVHNPAEYFILEKDINTSKNKLMKWQKKVFRFVRLKICWTTIIDIPWLGLDFHLSFKVSSVEMGDLLAENRYFFVTLELIFNHAAKKGQDQSSRVVSLLGGNFL